MEIGEEHYLDINEAEFKAFSQLPGTQAVVMLNLLKFKAKIDDTSMSGEDGYKAYMKAAMPFFNLANAEVLFFGKPQHTLIGPEDKERWDKVLLVKYKSVNDFLDMITSEGYPSDLRKQSLLDSRLIHCNS